MAGFSQDLDSLERLLKIQVSKDTVRIERLITLGSRKFNSDPEQSSLHFAEAFAIADSLQNKPYLAKLYQLNGIIYRRKNQYDTAVWLNRQALIIFRQLDRQDQEAGVVFSLANIFKARNQMDSALVYYQEAGRLANEIDNKRIQAYAAKGMADVLSVFKKHDQALNMYFESYEILVDTGDLSGQSTLLSNIGSEFIKVNQNDSALVYIQKSKLIKEQINDIRGLTVIYNNLASIFNTLHITDSAIFYQEEALLLQLRFGNKEALALSHINLASFQLEKGNYRKSANHLSQSLALATEVQSNDLLSKTYKYQYRLDSAMGNYSAAFAALKSHHANKDSVDSNERTRVVDELQTKYETEKKEAEIVLLSQQSEIQRLVIQQKNQTIWISVMLFGLLMAVGYLLYRQRTLSTERARVSLEQRFLRSQLNPHFIFNALMAIQNFMMKNSADQAALYLGKFSKLMRVILENSREEFISVAAEVEMLRNYLDIHKLRLNDSFDFSIILDDSIDSEMDTIPPMFVQPFVENAIEHGIVNAVDRGNIQLKFTKEGSFIAIQITDNGGGLSASSETVEHKSLASKIIQERMAFFNKALKDKIQLVLAEMKDQNGQVLGTRVELRVPFAYL